MLFDFFCITLHLSDSPSQSPSLSAAKQSQTAYTAAL
jgi:hypothetical protein